MKRNYTNLISIFAMWCMAMFCYASEPEAINRVCKERTIASTQLSDLHKITFTDTQMLLHLTDGNIVEHNLTQFDKIVFGEYQLTIGLDELISYGTDFYASVLEDKWLVVTASSAIHSLQLIDLSGKSVQVNLFGEQSNQVKLSVNLLVDGLYVIYAQTNEGIKTTKILIQ